MPKTYNTISNFVEKFGDKMEYNKETNTIELGANVEVDGNLTVNGQGGGGGTELVIANIALMVEGPSDLTGYPFSINVAGFKKDIAERILHAVMNGTQPLHDDMVYLGKILTGRTLPLWLGSGINWKVLCLQDIRYNGEFNFGTSDSFYFQITNPNTFYSQSLGSQSIIRIIGVAPVE